MAAFFQCTKYKDLYDEVDGGKGRLYSGGCLLSGVISAMVAPNFWILAIREKHQMAASQFLCNQVQRDPRKRPLTGVNLILGGTIPVEL